MNGGKTMNQQNIFKCSMLFLLLGLIGVMGGNAKTVSASSVTSLRTGVTYQEYDITGDGKADTLLAKDTGKRDEWYQAFEVYINGQCALKVKGRYLNYYESTVKLVSFDSGAVYLYVYLSGDNGDGPVDLYAYQNGKLKKALNLLKPMKHMGFHAGADIHDVNGDQMVVWMESMSYGLAHVNFEAIYRYQDGKLVLQSRTHKILGYYNAKLQKTGISKLTTSGKMQLYQSKTLKKKSRVLAKGTKLRVTKCYISGKKVAFYVKTLDGKTGWFRSKYTAKEPFREVIYAG